MTFIALGDTADRELLLVRFFVTIIASIRRPCKLHGADLIVCFFVAS
jgi:hypothetical protein